MGRTIPLNEEMQEKARRLYVPGVFGYKAVAKTLGIAPGSVRRYVNPEARERDLRASRQAKKKRTGTCANCGAVTRYNGRTNNGPSVICKDCNNFQVQTRCKRGHILTPETRDASGACRLCRNAWMREYTRRKRREAGVPERGRYAPSRAMRELQALNSEGAASK